jgi:DNA mismatch endonuclease, patch repair protein
MDTLTKFERSALMSKIRARGNKSTELRFVKLLRKWRLCGWRRNQRLFGQPDFVFKQDKVAVFIDGCFWHGCKQHCRLPATNRSYWLEKISRNKLRDGKVNRILRRHGWEILRIWQHELNQTHEARLLHRIHKALDISQT